MVERMWGLGVPGDLIEYLREKIRKPLVKCALPLQLHTFSL